MSNDMNDAPAPLCGFSSDEIRSLLRRIGDQIWHPIDFTLRLRIPPRAGFDLANALLAQGYVAGVAGWRADKGRLPGVELTPLGRRLTRERRLQPIPRRQAAAIIAKVTARIADVNGRPGFMHRIVEAHVIGSWCWAEEEVTLVDIGIRLASRAERTRQMKQDLAAEHDAVARLARRWKVLDVAEILRLVQGRTPHLRVYDYRDAARLGPWRERVYPPVTDEGDGQCVSSTEQARARRRVGRSKRRRISGAKHKRRRRPCPSAGIVRSAPMSVGPMRRTGTATGMRRPWFGGHPQSRIDQRAKLLGPGGFRYPLIFTTCHL